MMMRKTALVRPELEVVVFTVSSPRLPRSRNLLVEQAQKHGADFGLWLDADVGFPDDLLLRLIGHDLDVVGANYPVRSDCPEPTARRMDGSFVYPSPGRGVEQIGWLGTGALLTRLSVFDRIPRPYFAFEGDELGEDHFFCRSLHAAGIPLHTDHDLELTHVHQIALTNADVLKRRPGYVFSVKGGRP